MRQVSQPRNLSFSQLHHAGKFLVLAQASISLTFAQLIIICGYPTSGKTYRARQLISYFESRISTPESTQKPKFRIHHLTDPSLSISRSVYNLDPSSVPAHARSANSLEKDARATVFGAVKRLLSPNDIVVLDAAAGNYIKGWRYQLWCEAKAIRTTCCIVHVGASKDQARKANEVRLAARGNAGAEEQSQDKEEPYDPETWENLVFRFEEPNGMNRWDSPLFTVPYDDESAPGEEIWDAVIEPKGKGAVKPHAATLLPKMREEGYLHELERVTQEVVSKILEWQKDHPGEIGGEVAVEELTVELPGRNIGVPALQRLRRQFLALNRQHVIEVGRIKANFISYLNDSFEEL